MTAKEMFEALGYKETTTNYSQGISFCNPYQGGIIGKWQGVHFNHHKKYYSFIGTESHIASIELHKAITQQMKELGWIE
ncbi:MAG: hypothetical protein WC319_12155 [Candidatus Paceibacterota bacterium]|jgi:hypothetical protein